MRKYFLSGTALLALIAAFMAGCGTPVPGPEGPHTRIDNVPMYGQPALPRPDFMKQADDDFIRKAAGAYGGDRKTASMAWSSQADRFLTEGNLDYAMRRYNQAWLLNPDNFWAHWGFGRVLIQQDKFDEAFPHLEHALDLCTEDRQKPAILTDTGSGYFYRGMVNYQSDPEQRARSYAKAAEYYERSITLDPSYGNTWKRRAFLVFEQGDYAAAWKYSKQAQSLGATIPDPFLAKLRAAMPEPQ